MSDVDLHVVRMGTGTPPLVLVHGFTGSSLDWFEAMPRLAGNREVVAFDHRGHGDRPNTSDAATYTIEQLMADYEQLVEDQGLDRFHLLGHSMGGRRGSAVCSGPSRASSLAGADGHHGIAVAEVSDGADRQADRDRT